MKLVCPTCGNAVYLDLSQRWKMLAVSQLATNGVTPVAADFQECDGYIPTYFCKHCNKSFAGGGIDSLLVKCGQCENAVSVTEAVVNSARNIRCRGCANTAGPLAEKVIFIREVRGNKTVPVNVALKTIK